MTIERAIAICLDLARENIIDDPEMEREREKQECAVDTLETWYYSTFKNIHRKRYVETMGRT
jgi:hypothetical protein